MAWLLVIVLFCAVGTARSVGAAVSHWDEIRSAGLLAISLAWRLSLIATFLAAAYAVYCRRDWGRWFGVALFVACTAVAIFRHDTTHYANDAERAGGYLGRFIVLLLLAWLVYAFAFSSKAKRYFSKASLDAA
jgi:hypothetical protein